MRLTPREIDRLLLRQAAELARARFARGLSLSEPEARALIADAICEIARDGGSVADAAAAGAALLTEDDVAAGVAERIDVLLVEAFFPDGQKLVCVHEPIGPARRLTDAPPSDAPPDGPPPRWLPGDGPVRINADRPTLRLRVESVGDRPIHVGSHFHFFEVNPALRFDREAAWGFRLDIASGTTLRFEPGDARDVNLVAIGGARVVRGLNGLCDGFLDDPAVRAAAFARLPAFLER